MKFKRAIPHDISIKATPNGTLIVEVGCVPFAYSSNADLVRDLTEYLENPEECIKKYNEFSGHMARVDIGNLPDIGVRPYHHSRCQVRAERNPEY